MNGEDFSTNKYYQSCLANGITSVKDILEAGISIEIFVEMLEAFLEEAETKMPDCESYSQAGDIKNYTIIVHGLKNDAAVISDAELSELARSHEIKGKEGNLEFIRENWPELKIKWLATVNRIKKVLQEAE